MFLELPYEIWRVGRRETTLDYGFGAYKLPATIQCRLGAAGLMLAPFRQT